MSETTTTGTWRSDLEAWHAGRLERLRAEDGYLTLVALEWLEEGANTVGREDADVAYDGFPVDRVGTLTKEGATFTFEPAPGVRVDGLPEGGRIRSDEDGAPVILGVGPVRFHVIERVGRYGVRIKDPRAGTRTGFTGIDRFPPDPGWVVEADLVETEPGTTLPIELIIGGAEDQPIVARARFERAGESLDLALLQGSGDRHFLIFADETNGRETYGAGRFLEVEPAGEGRVRIDFNRAFNPPCSLTPFATCPMPPDSNRLPFRVEAGELAP